MEKQKVLIWVANHLPDLNLEFAANYNYEAKLLTSPPPPNNF